MKSLEVRKFLTDLRTVQAKKEAETILTGIAK